MTSGSSNAIWLNLAGSEPDLYFPSIASATTGSCSPPEEVDWPSTIVQQLSQLAIADPSSEKHDHQTNVPAYAAWEQDLFSAEQDFLISPRPFADLLREGRDQDQHFPRYRPQHQTSGADVNNSLGCFAQSQSAETLPRRVQSDVHLPIDCFGISAHQAAALRPSASHLDIVGACPLANESLQSLFEREQQKQDALMTALMLLRNNVRHVHAGIEGIQEEQTEHSEEVAAAWQGQSRQWLPLN